MYVDAVSRMQDDQDEWTLVEINGCSDRSDQHKWPLQQVCVCVTVGQDSQEYLSNFPNFRLLETFDFKK